jgi:hypothetical protein
MKKNVSTRLALIPAAALLALLAACGGGGEDAGTPGTSVTQSQAQAMSANSAVVPAETTDAATVLLSTTQAVVAGGTAGATFSCAGGGTATFTATGSNLGNGQLDAGEVYTVTYTACKGSAGAASLDGAATLTVVSAGAGSVVVDTATSGIVITLPQRVLTLNGSSRLSQTVVTSGATTTTTNHWTSPQIVVTSQRNARSSTFTLTGIDITRSITTTNGVITARSSSGTHTMNAVLPNGTWTVTTATNGAVSYDANGVPTQGDWTITLPNNRIGVSVVPGTLTVTVDFGADGSIDRTYVFTTTVIAAEAG